MSMYKEGTQVFNPRSLPYFDALTRECVGASFEEVAGEARRPPTKAAKVASPRTASSSSRTSRPAAVGRGQDQERPGVGTGDAKAGPRAHRFSKVAPPPIGSSDAELKAMIAYSIKERTLMDKASKALSYAQTKNLACEEFLGTPATCSRCRRPSTRTWATSRKRSPEKARGPRPEEVRAVARRHEQPGRGEGTDSWDDQGQAGQRRVRRPRAGEGARRQRGAVPGARLATTRRSTVRTLPWPTPRRSSRSSGRSSPSSSRTSRFPSNTKKDAARDARREEVAEGRKVVHGPSTGGT